MPAISIVVCVHNERDLLARLLQHALKCCDDLVVVHDGPDLLRVREIVERFGGRFLEAPRRGSIEAQSPFGWAQAKYNWILRLDADEFPSPEMVEWLVQFRTMPEPPSEISGYTCIWPIWNGNRAVTRHWPRGRIFLFNRQRVRFFGQVEQTPIPEGTYEFLPMVLHHQPRRRSHGLRNVLIRRQARVWRNLIATGLLGKPTDLPCWRWESDVWPDRWEEVRQKPIRTGLSRLIMDTLRTLRDQLKYERRLLVFTGISGPLHHLLFCIRFWRLRDARNRDSGISSSQF